MVVIPGAGHSPQVEQPDEFAAVLQDFWLGARVTRPQQAGQLSFRERVLTGIIHQVSNIMQRR